MTYHEALQLTVDRWNETPIADEWIFEKFREEFIGPMSSLEAFEAVGETVELLVQQTDESTATEILQTIISLARQSDTTEIPTKVMSYKAVMEDQFAAFDDYARNKLQELFRYYRL